MYMYIWYGCSGGWNRSEHLEQPPTNLGNIYKERVVGAEIQSTTSNCSYLMFGRISFKMRWHLSHPTERSGHCSPLQPVPALQRSSLGSTVETVLSSTAPSVELPSLLKQLLGKSKVVWEVSIEGLLQFVKFCSDPGAGRTYPYYYFATRCANTKIVRQDIS